MSEQAACVHPVKKAVKSQKHKSRSRKQQFPQNCCPLFFIHVTKVIADIIKTIEHFSKKHYNVTIK